MSEGLEILDIMSSFENQDDCLTPLKEISRQIASVAVHISADDTLNEKYVPRYNLKLSFDFGFGLILWTNYPVYMLYN